MINPAARELYQDYLTETDPVCEEMLRQAYLRALMEPEPTAPTEADLDEFAARLPVGLA